MSLRPSDIPAKRVRELESGDAETKNLAEALAIDTRRLALNTLPSDVVARVREQDFGAGVVRRTAAVGEAIAEIGGDGLIDALCAHPSDTVRGWVCYAIGALPGMTIHQRLRRIKRLADDPHFGVREWAWLGVRPHIIESLDEALRRLASWSTARSANIRRFASEATRPRGVWCAHIKALKADPSPALPILEPLRSDQAKYVQDSVANWLNDASKARPDWVREVCDRWSSQSPTPETARIVRRGLRSL